MNTKANIIIIEDEKNICNFIETVLSPQGYHLQAGVKGLLRILITSSSFCISCCMSKDR